MVERPLAFGSDGPELEVRLHRGSISSVSVGKLFSLSDLQTEATVLSCKVAVKIDV